MQIYLRVVPQTDHIGVWVLPSFAFVLMAMGLLGFDFHVMLQQFSWGHFLVASIVLNLIWYGLVVLVFYRAELLAFLGGQGIGSAIPQASKGNDGDVVGRLGRSQGGPGGCAGGVEESLMGASRLPDGVEVLSSSQVAFFVSDDHGDRYEQVGLVSDVVQELKLIFSELERKDGGKPEFIRMAGKLTEEYGSIGGHPSIGAINSFIQSSAPFAISGDELDQLWY